MQFPNCDSTRILCLDLGQLYRIERLREDFEDDKAIAHGKLLAQGIVPVRDGDILAETPKEAQVHGIAFSDRSVWELRSILDVGCYKFAPFQIPGRIHLCDGLGSSLVRKLAAYSMRQIDLGHALELSVGEELNLTRDAELAVEDLVGDFDSAIHRIDDHARNQARSRDDTRRRQRPRGRNGRRARGASFEHLIRVDKPSFRACLR